MVFPDGNVTLDLKVTGVSRSSWEDGEVLEITSRDTFYPFTVKAFYKTYRSEDMISTWTELTNEGKMPMTLTRFDSGTLPFRYSDAWISYLYGSWGNEGRVASEPLNRGMKVIKNKDGVRNSHSFHSEVMISLDGKPSENAGRVIGAALCYSGNYELRFNTVDSDYHRFFAGICPDNSEYALAAKESFATPELAFTFPIPESAEPVATSISGAAIGRSLTVMLSAGYFSTAGKESIWTSTKRGWTNDGRHCIHGR